MRFNTMANNMQTNQWSSNMSKQMHTFEPNPKNTRIPQGDLPISRLEIASRRENLDGNFPRARESLAAIKEQVKL